MSYREELAEQERVLVERAKLLSGESSIPAKALRAENLALLVEKYQRTLEEASLSREFG